jgi:hypothetical protein
VKQIRGIHPYTFRSGEWAELKEVASGFNRRDCYLVEFSDGIQDFWVVDDPNEPYEFREIADREVVNRLKDGGKA